MKISIIAGPTAIGKTSIALNVASIVKNVEIISADAFQVYKGLDIGTAKISIEDRASIPHHLIDIMEPGECYTAGLFCDQAESLIEEIMSRGNVPLVVGGTGLYIKTLTEGIFDCPDIDPEIKINLQKRLESEGLEALYRELKTLDPEYAERISMNDPARTVRALEVSIGLNMPFTKAHKVYYKAPKYDYNIYIPEEDRASLYGGINKRTDIMWKKGWPEEVKGLLDKGISEKAPAFRAIGYKLIADFIQNGGSAINVIEEIGKETRHFAKRQLTWFRGMDKVIFYKNKETMTSDIISACGNVL